MPHIATSPNLNRRPPRVGPISFRYKSILDMGTNTWEQLNLMMRCPCMLQLASSSIISPEIVKQSWFCLNATALRISTSGHSQRDKVVSTTVTIETKAKIFLEQWPLTTGSEDWRLRHPHHNQKWKIFLNLLIVGHWPHWTQYIYVFLVHNDNNNNNTLVLPSFSPDILYYLNYWEWPIWLYRCKCS